MTHDLDDAAAVEREERGCRESFVFWLGSFVGIVILGSAGAWVVHWATQIR